MKYVISPNIPIWPKGHYEMKSEYIAASMAAICERRLLKQLECLVDLPEEHSNDASLKEFNLVLAR